MDNLLSGRKDVFGILCIGIIAAVLLFCLWPFNFWPENKVRWLNNQNGLQFHGRGIIFSHLPGPYSLHPLSIEIFLQPATEDSSRIGHIISFINDKKTGTF